MPEPAPDAEPFIEPEVAAVPEPVEQVDSAPEPVAAATVHEEIPFDHAAETAPPVAEPAALREAVAAAGAPDDGFLARPDHAPGEPDNAQPFLRRVGTRNIGEVEVPAPRETPPEGNRSPTVGLRPQTPGEDLSAPAYSRKYMD